MLNTSNPIYFLDSDSKFYKIIGASRREVGVEEVAHDHNKLGVLIDDSYFFYIGMDFIPLTGKKLQAVITNYLQSSFPPEMVANFSYSVIHGTIIIYLLKKELIDIITSNNIAFTNTKKLSTPLLESVAKYEEFAFQVGDTIYKKENRKLIISNGEAGAPINAEIYLENAREITQHISLPGVIKKSVAKLPLFAPILLLSVIYFAFLIGGIFEVVAASKVKKAYEAELNKVFMAAGVDKTADPYGVLLQRYKAIGGAGSTESTLSTLKVLEAAAIEGVRLETLSIKDNDVKVIGSADSFAKVDEMKRAFEIALKKAVQIDDTRQVGNNITFTLHYSKSK